MNVGLTVFEEVGLLRVGSLFSKPLLLSGGHYYGYLQATSCPYFPGVITFVFLLYQPNYEHR